MDDDDLASLSLMRIVGLSPLDVYSYEYSYPLVAKP